MPRTRTPRSRTRVYLTVRLVAAASFLLAATVLPRGIPAALVVMAAGVAAVLTCFGTNAGGPGERAGARMQDRHFDAVMPPQGDWPPYVPDQAPPPQPAAVQQPAEAQQPAKRADRP